MASTNGKLPPPPPLPQAKEKRIAVGVTLLPPLTRRGTGPGLILLVPDYKYSPTTIKDGIPSTLMKWAEEGFTVVEMQEQAFRYDEDEERLFNTVLEELSKCEKCDNGDNARSIGVIVYEPSLLDHARNLCNIPDISCAVVYGDASKAPSLTDWPTKVQQHLAGRASNKPGKTENVIVYDYPQASSYSFAFPFQDKFHYSSESVAHTRNLQFLKPIMKGPYFDLEAIWEEHTNYEFENRSVEHTMATMVQEPYVNHIPTMTGGTGRFALTKFYKDHFIFSNPPDSELELISRTVGIDRVVDEFIFKFEHSQEVPWLIPGIPPTGKHLAIPMTAVVNIRGDRLYHEHIDWNQASVLFQLGLLPEYLDFPFELPGGRTPKTGKKFEYRVPAAGQNTAKKMRDKNSVPSNEMMKYEVREV